MTDQFSARTMKAEINRGLAALVEGRGQDCDVSRIDARTIDDLKELGSGQPAPQEVVRLYLQAFDDFGVRALWSSRPVERPTVTGVLSITESLRAAGNLDARRLAERIEQACRAALSATDSTKLRCVVDSDFWFDPAQRDPDFGDVLHPADLATNKILAAAGRREPRDIVDLVDIHDHVLPLGAVAWAAVGPSLGFTPEGLINDVRRFARYTAADFERVASVPPVDAGLVMRRLRAALDEADAFVRRMPTAIVGMLFLKDGRPVQPDPDQLDSYTMHPGARRGHWPSSAEIGSDA